MNNGVKKELEDEEDIDDEFVIEEEEEPNFDDFDHEEDPMPFKCGMCSKEFADKDMLKNHIDVDH